jgi:hypothetical protein
MWKKRRDPKCDQAVHKLNACAAPLIRRILHKAVAGRVRYEYDSY